MYNIRRSSVFQFSYKMTNMYIKQYSTDSAIFAIHIRNLTFYLKVYFQTARKFIS